MLLMQSLNDCPSSASPFSDSFECCLAKKHFTWTHQRYSKRNFSTLLHPSASQIQCLPWKCQTPGTELLWNLQKENISIDPGTSSSSLALYHPLRNPLRILDHLETQLLYWTISRHLSEKLPLSGHLGDRCPLCRIIQHQPDSTGNFSGLLRRHQT